MRRERRDVELLQQKDGGMKDAWKYILSAKRKKTKSKLKLKSA